MAYGAASAGQSPNTSTNTTADTNTSSTSGGNIVQVNLELQSFFEARKNKLPIINPQINAIHKVTERAVKNQTAKKSQFYDGNGRVVSEGTSYHIHYTSKITQHFMTGAEHNKLSKLIYPIRIRNSEFSYYNFLNKQSPLKLISKVTPPTEKQYKKKSFARYFAKQANDESQPSFEIHKNDFQTSPLYIYVTLTWHLTGLRDDVYDKNIREIESVSNTMPSIGNILTPFQFFRYEDNLSDEDRLRNKLANMMDLSNYNTTTQSNINVSSTEGLGDGSGDGGGLVSDSSSYTTDADGNIEDEEKMC
jgi:hypothetical protein|tara:strand:+ start:985 stop:1899 length:915 start_codon:yes stop_codon:yes gene_type:complete